MNPNVAIELGYSLATLGDSKLLMILNTFYGSRESLPFDLKHKAGPLIYSLAPSATKDEIAAAERDLTGRLRVALRLVLKSASTDKQDEVHKETEPSTENPARYFGLKEVPTIFSNSEYKLADGPLLYLRILPVRAAKPLKRSDAYDLLQGGAVPIYPSGMLSYLSRNKHGAVSFTMDAAKQVVLEGMQVFMNREIWAFDTVLLRKKNKPPVLSIPTLSFEQGIARAIHANLAFSTQKLGLELPLLLEVGAYPVEHYIFAMPDNDSGGSEPIRVNHVHYRDQVTGADNAKIDQIILRVFEEFFESTGERRPLNLNNFPNAIPGTLPS